MKEINVPVATLYTCYSYKGGKCKMPYYNYNIDYLLSRPNSTSSTEPDNMFNFIGFVHIKLGIILDVIGLLDPIKYVPIFKIQYQTTDKIEQLRLFNKRVISIINGRKELIYGSPKIIESINLGADKLFEKFKLENNIKS